MNDRSFCSNINFYRFLLVEKDFKICYIQFMILLDGRKLAEKVLGGLKEEIAKRKKLLRLAVVIVGENSVTLKFI